MRERERHSCSCAVRSITNKGLQVPYVKPRTTSALHQFIGPGHSLWSGLSHSSCFANLGIHGPKKKSRVKQHLASKPEFFSAVHVGGLSVFLTSGILLLVIRVRAAQPRSSTPSRKAPGRWRSYC